MQGGHNFIRSKSRSFFY